MKLKIVSLLARAALILGSATTAISIQPSAQAQMPIMQTLLQDLDLSANQQQQLNVLRQSTRSQVEETLTPEQQVQLQAVFIQGEDLRQSIASMNLTTQQRQEIRGIFQSARGDLKEILTPEQQETLRQTIRSQWRQFQGDRS